MTLQIRMEYHMDGFGLTKQRKSGFVGDQSKLQLKNNERDYEGRDRYYRAVICLACMGPVAHEEDRDRENGDVVV